MSGRERPPLENGEAARERLFRQIELLTRQIAIEKQRAERLTEERDEARAFARVLAHAYTTDNRPPATIVAAALAFPVIPVEIRSTLKEKS